MDGQWEYKDLRVWGSDLALVCWMIDSFIQQIFMQFMQHPQGAGIVLTVEDHRQCVRVKLTLELSWWVHTLFLHFYFLQSCLAWYVEALCCKLRPVSAPEPLLTQSGETQCPLPPAWWSLAASPKFYSVDTRWEAITIEGCPFAPPWVQVIVLLTSYLK